MKLAADDQNKFSYLDIFLFFVRSVFTGLLMKENDPKSAYTFFDIVLQIIHSQNENFKLMTSRLIDCSTLFPRSRHLRFAVARFIPGKNIESIAELKLEEIVIAIVSGYIEVSAHEKLAAIFLGNLNESE